MPSCRVGELCYLEGDTGTPSGVCQKTASGKGTFCSRQFVKIQSGKQGEKWGRATKKFHSDVRDGTYGEPRGDYPLPYSSSSSNSSSSSGNDSPLSSSSKSSGDSTYRYGGRTRKRKRTRKGKKSRRKGRKRRRRRTKKH